MANLTVTAQQGDTLDRLIWRHLGPGLSNGNGLVEQALDLNRGMADEGPILAEGRTVILPPAQANTPAAITLVQLWD